MVNHPNHQPGSPSWLRWLEAQISPPATAHVEPLAYCVGEWIHALLAAGDAYLVIELDGFFVQFLVLDGTYLRAEAVGEHYLHDHRAYTAAQTTMLDRLGWLHPDVEFVDHPEIDPEDCGKNYWRTWEPADIGAAATLAALTLTTVLGLDDTNLHRIDMTIGCPAIETP